MPAESNTPLLPPCLCLAGPTASGKTGTALRIAKALEPDHKVEIISVDSALVYRGMDIGTAKPTAHERAEVIHHLIDIVEPNEAYSAARFVQDAVRLAHDISARGHLPLLVGGTMLYFKALFDGLDPMPSADPAVREELAQQMRAQGLGGLYRELQRVDPATAQRLAPNDSQRIQRALEVFRVSGQPISAFHRSQPRPARPLPPLLSLEPSDRTWLHERIAQRLHQMLTDGLIEEVRGLMQRPELHADLPSMRCVGYRQTWEALESGHLEGLADRCIAATRQLAKRQITWLRSMPAPQTLACDDAHTPQRAIDWARQQLHSLGFSST